MHVPHFPIEPEPYDFEKANFDTLVDWACYPYEDEWFPSLPEDLLTAVVAVRNAIRFINNRFERYYLYKPEKMRKAFKVRKPDGTSITLEDRAAQDIIVSIIRKRCPNDGILAEEGIEEGTRRKRRWIIDALDGTQEFYRGRRNFCSTIALVEHKTPVLGVIQRGRTLFCDDLQFAMKGYGAKINSRTESGYPEETRVSRCQDIQKLQGALHNWVVKTILENPDRPSEFASYIRSIHDDSEELRLMVDRSNSPYAHEKLRKKTARRYAAEDLRREKELKRRPR